MSRSFVFPCLTALAALLALSGHAADAATLRVPSQYPTIQGAIDASRTGDTILVAPGTYVEGLTIRDKGILTLESEAGADSTILDGTGATNVIEVSASKNSHRTEYRISGFTIRNGAYGGIRGTGGRTLVENNIVIGNATVDGYAYGAVSLQDSSGSIRHNLIKGNRATGVSLLDPHQVLVEGNRIEDNITGIDVEQAYHWPDGSAKVIRNVVKNSRYRDFHTYGTLRLQAADNLIVRNVDANDISVLLVGGTAFDDGTLTGKFVNNTVVATVGNDRLVTFNGDMSGLEFANNIIYAANDATALTCWSYDGRPVMHHNDVFSAHGWSLDGACGDFANDPGNMLVDPGFAQDGWMLNPDSPLIDAGSNHPIRHLRRDIRGVSRIVDGGHGPVVDMGAYEYLPK
jgi:hypothetical protein